MKAPLPDNEEGRLKTLNSLDLLDTEAEPEFDELTALAAQICNMPVALISLVDHNRQWFKAKVGLDVSETSRDVAFCAYSILTPDQIMEIPDALLDKRFSENPLVTETPKFRFYAGIPLVASNGHALGTLCVLDYKPGKLNGAQKVALEALRLLIIRHIELRYSFDSIKSLGQKLTDKNEMLELEAVDDAITLQREISSRIEAEILSRRILDVSLDAVITINIEGKVSYWNPRATEIFGYSSEYVQGKKILDLIIDPSTAEAFDSFLNKFSVKNIKTINPERFEFKAHTAGGKSIQVEVSVTVLRRYGEYVFVGFLRDLTELNKTTEELRISAITFNSQEGMIIADGEMNVLRVNEAFTDITGYSSDEVVGGPPRFFNSDHVNEKYYSSIWKSFDTNDGWEGELWDKRKNGEVVPLNVVITVIRGHDSLAKNYVIGISDITRTKKDAEEIFRLAFYDPLTGLPNRRLLMDRLNEAVTITGRKIEKAALLFVDLDNFKDLNDNLGHDYGDMLLKQTAQRLKLGLRSEDIVARIGRDEFVIILQHLGEDGLDAPQQTRAVASKILSALNEPYMLKDHECFSSASIGATLFDSREVDVDDLVKQADIAMYQAKQGGRNMLRFFDPKMQENITQRAKMENALHNALEKDQFELYYQLQVDENNIASGAEALLRWKHPSLGIVSPLDFIPLAENSGLIIPIGNWVIKTACRQIQEWQKNPKTSGLTVAINISPRQFFQTNFVNEVLEALEETGINSSLLKFEITEGLILDDVDSAIIKMKKLKRRGVEFSLDDFGTGYSSLAYLTRLPLSQLKIDQSFVSGIGHNARPSIIIKTIIAMSKNLGLEVVAEGVETKAQFDFPEPLGCELYQGYLFSKPMPALEFEDALA